MEKNQLKGKSMWVVKIGGSLLGSPELACWLEAVANYGDGKIIIVPGGGVFADAVREAQKVSKISDTCAHRLAVLAMDQLGLLLANMNPALATASTPMEIDERRWQHRGIIWLPSKMVLADDTIPQNWDTTSDSIAAWLAKEIDAKHLVLVKSIKPTGGNLKLKDVTKDGLVDAEFGDFALDKEFSPWIVKKTDHVHFEDGIDEQKLSKFGSLILH
ncbi:MAG TPA: uridylate kinase [Methylotenera sp.]|nr:uridylate kinase [Methylotenera sp.]